MSARFARKLSMTILRSIAAVAAGAVVVVALSTGTDLALENSIFPSMNTPEVTPQLLAVALAYRTVYGVFAGWVTARLSSTHAMEHALVLGAIGTVLAGVGVFVMWSFGQHWYPIALTVLSLPQAWLGGKLAGIRRNS
jgi:hypothetical protein